MNLQRCDVVPLNDDTRNRFREGPEHFPLTSQSALAAGLSDLHPRDLHHLAIGDHALGCADASPAFTRSTKETIDRGL
jgi:hypothetical protein